MAKLAEEGHTDALNLTPEQMAEKIMQGEPIKKKRQQRKVWISRQSRTVKIICLNGDRAGTLFHRHLTLTKTVRGK